MANLGFTPPVMGGGASTLQGVYQNALGRSPDAAGLAFYQQQLDQGQSFEDMRQAIWSSPEAQQYHGSGNVFDTAGGAYNQAVNMAGSAHMGGNYGSVNPTNVQAGLLRETDLDPYMNPFTQSVTNQALSDLGRSHDIAMNQTNSAASGAFGGSRHGVMQAETNRNFADATARTSAGLNSQNYSNAQAAAFQDIGNQLTADMSNQQANLQAGISNAGNRLTADMGNASNQLAAAGQLGQLSNLGFTLGNNALGAQQSAGNAQQGLMQALINAGKRQTEGQTGEADAALSRLLAAIGGVPVPQSTTQTESPGLMDLLTAFV